MQAAHQLLKSPGDHVSAAQWVDLKWNMEWKTRVSRLHEFLPEPDTQQKGIHLPQPVWVKLNHLQIGVGCFLSSMHK